MALSSYQGRGRWVFPWQGGTDPVGEYAFTFAFFQGNMQIGLCLDDVQAASAVSTLAAVPCLRPCVAVSSGQVGGKSRARHDQSGTRVVAKLLPSALPTFPHAPDATMTQPRPRAAPRHDQTGTAAVAISQLRVARPSTKP